MDIITFIASRLWLLFSYVGNCCRMSIGDIINGVDVLCTNPFNSHTWVIDVPSWLGNIFEFFFDFVPVSQSTTVLDCMLVLTCTVFVVGFILRLITGLLQN